MRIRTIVVGVVLGALCISVAFGALDAKTEAHYGLKTIREPYAGRIRQVIGLSMIQYKAIRSSGFKVYKLQKITQDRLGAKYYRWTGLDGGPIQTKHFLGTGSIFMQAGDAYIGKTDPVWLSVYREGIEVKFTILR